MVTISSSSSEQSSEYTMKYISSGRFVTSDEWIHPSRIIDSYEIIYVIKGEVFIAEEEHKYTLLPGCVLLLEPGKRHGGYRHSKGVSFYWIHFSTSNIDCVGLKNKQYSFRTNNYHLELIFKQILHTSNTDGYPDSINDIATAMLLGEVSYQQKCLIDKRPPMLTEITEWIRVNSNKKITVNAVSLAFGYNRDYLAKLFKKHFDVGIHQHITAQRLKYIKSLILTTDYTLKQIAGMSGFDDYKEFLKYFKYHEKVSPLNFRNIYFNTHLNNK